MHRNIIIVASVFVILFRTSVNASVKDDKCYENAFFEPAHIEIDRLPYNLNSGLHTSTPKQRELKRMYNHVIQKADAQWLRVYFDDHNLGRQSYLTITSLKDGSRQYFNSKTLSEWNNASAYFNGNAVEIELYVGSGDHEVFFSIGEIKMRKANLAEKTNNSSSSLIGICDGIDEREPTDPYDYASGRLVEDDDANVHICTAWLTSNGAYLSAGHCPIKAGDLIQFNVPLSNGWQDINHPPAEDQFPINSIIDSRDEGIGNDWLVFDVSPNSNTGLLPVEAYGEFYRLQLGTTTETFRVTGYGIDDDPPEHFGIQQTATGSNEGETINSQYDAFWEFRVDVTSGNSGSPIIIENNLSSVGIVTHAGCHISLNNFGTSFNNELLAYAINTYPNDVVAYVDQEHPSSQGNGTIFAPYETVSDGVNNVPVGGILSIVTGHYDETLVIDKAMTIEAPVGLVTIGPAVPSAKIAGPYSGGSRSRSDLGLSDRGSFELSHNFPNPFNPITNIEYTIPDRVEVRLSVYDVLGRRVATLVNDIQEPGTYRVLWDATHMASGLYFYKLKAGEFTKSRQMSQ